MTVGLRTYKADGSLRLEITDRTSRVVGVIQTGKSNGSITLPGQAFFAILNNDPSEAGRVPFISVSGGTITWSWTVPGASYNVDCAVVVGVY